MGLGHSFFLHDNGTELILWQGLATEIFVLMEEWEWLIA